MNKDFEDHIYIITNLIRLICEEDVDALTNASKFLLKNFTREEIANMSNETIYELYTLHNHPQK